MDFEFECEARFSFWICIEKYGGEVGLTHVEVGSTLWLDRLFMAPD